MIYLTYNDAPGGIYQSQVIDTCRFWEETFDEEALLIALISGRNFSACRKQIKQAWRHSIVLPMYPGIANWKKNSRLIKLVMLSRTKDNVIARGVFATLLARGNKKFTKVCFDARGAYAAEWSEYLKSESAAIEKEMKKLEGDALLKSDSSIAVSQKLVEYWKENFNYTHTNHVVIPCTLSKKISTEYDGAAISKVRKQLSFTDSDVVLVYSGSSAKWQSFHILEETVTKALTQNPSLKLLMLCKAGEEKALADKFPGRVIQKWVDEDEVHSYLQAADYGLLIREESITNKVSSPVKFAEYLAAGLPVIISENIGDYSAFVTEKKCGTLVANTDWANIKRPTETEKKNIQAIAEQYFKKSSYTEEYKKLF
jgi:hypothetical protein